MAEEEQGTNEEQTLVVIGINKNFEALVREIITLHVGGWQQSGLSTVGSAIGVALYSTRRRLK